MHTLAEAEEVIGFFSYSRDDDEDSGGALSDLRDAIQRELGGLLGRSRRTLRLWQDKEAIVPGKLWEAEIKVAASQAVFFIPIVTPRTLNSGYCAFEFQAFLDRERELGRDDLMFPILYIRVPELETEALWRDRPVLSVIGARQYVNWQKLRQRDIRDREVREAVGSFCATIADALRAPITPAIVARAEAEAERRRALEAARVAEASALAAAGTRRDEAASRTKPHDARDADETKRKEPVGEPPERRRVSTRAPRAFGMYYSAAFGGILVVISLAMIISAINDGRVYVVVLAIASMGLIVGGLFLWAALLTFRKRQRDLAAPRAAPVSDERAG